jgi:hypothetical protein
MLRPRGDFVDRVRLPRRVRLASMTTSPPLGWPDRISAKGSGSKVALMVALGIVLVAGAGVGIGMMVWQEPTTTAAQAARSLGAASDAPAIDGLDAATRRATLGSATLTLPPEPYVLYPDPVQLDGVVSVIFLANADVHPNYDQGRDWQATVALARMSSSLTDADLERAGDRVLRELGRQFFGGHPTKMTNVRSADRAVDGQPGMEFRADVYYSADGLPSRYDRVVVWLVRDDGGTLVAAISSVPNDTTSEVADLAATAIDSLTVA